MDKIIVVTPVPGDARVLEDLLREHFPGIKVETVGNQEQRDERELSLIIERTDGATGYRVSLRQGGKMFSHTEVLPGDLFHEEKINRERRLLRLAVFRTISRYFQESDLPDSSAARWGPSPWGVLTGVRPTKIIHRMWAQGFTKSRILHHLTRDYGFAAKKARLAVETAENQLPFLPDREQAGQTAGVYIGIPFCPSRCHYCSFPSFSLARWGYLLEDYLDALFREIRTVGDALRDSGIKVESIYLGGGTPTILSPVQLARLFTVIEDSFGPDQEREITAEGGRPDTLDADKLKVLKNHGVTRLSINPQTMHDPTLEAIGRKHTAGEIIHAFELARKTGFPVLNMDLIIGLPGENSGILQKTLDEVTALAPENVTLHALAIKRAALYNREPIALPGQAEGARMMDRAQEILCEAGYRPYYLYRQKQSLAYGENVGYALDGQVCLYNIKMMEERQTILGCGVGAGSKIVDSRDWSVDNFYNPKDLLVYLQRLEEINKRKVDKLRAFV